MMTTNFTMMTKKTVLRVAKLNKYALKGTADHSLRKSKTDNVNPEKTKENKILLGSGNIKDDVISYIYNNRTSTKAIRKDAVLAEELVLSASPDFFAQDQGEEDIVKKWATAQMEFLKEEYGANCVSAVLHMDELTPHIHAFVVPIIDNKLSHKEWNNKRGGKHSYTKLQDRYEAFNKPLFDLTRVKKNALNATHTELKQHYSNVKKLKNYYKKALLKTKNIFDVNKYMPKKFFGMYKENDIKQALTRVSKTNSKELLALKSKNIELEDKIASFKTENLKLKIENNKLIKYYNNNKNKINFVDTALKYNLIELFKKQILIKKIEEKKQKQIEMEKQLDLKKEAEQAQKLQQLQQTPTLTKKHKLKNR